MLNIILDVSASGNNEIGLIEMIKQGGITMIPLFILALIAIAILIERILTISNAAKNTGPFMEEIRALIVNKNINEAVGLCQRTNSPLSRMILKGLKRLGSSLKTIEDSIESVGKLEIDRLEKNLSLLATISGAAPMIGFLGTVLGMIKTFQVITHEANQSIQDMAGGISEAMVTTATGLIVGIIAYISYNFLSSKVQKIIHALENASVDFLDVLHEPQN